MAEANHDIAVPKKLKAQAPHEMLESEMPKARKRTGRRPLGAPSSREALLRAAVRRFAALGYEGASLRMIAADAGTAPALAVQRFKSKAGLYEAVVEHLVERQKPTLEHVRAIAEKAAEEPAESLREWVRVLVGIGSDLSDVPALLMHEASPAGASAASGSVKAVCEDAAGRAEALHKRLIEPFRAASLPVLERAAQAGVLKSRSPAMAFSLILGALAASLLMPLSRPAVSPMSGSGQPDADAAGAEEASSAGNAASEALAEELLLLIGAA